MAPRKPKIWVFEIAGKAQLYQCLRNPVASKIWLDGSNRTVWLVHARPLAVSLNAVVEKDVAMFRLSLVRLPFLGFEMSIWSRRLDLFTPSLDPCGGPGHGETRDTLLSPPSSS